MTAGSRPLRLFSAISHGLSLSRGRTCPHSFTGILGKALPSPLSLPRAWASTHGANLTQRSSLVDLCAKAELIAGSGPKSVDKNNDHLDYGTGQFWP